jgi:DNA-binding MarR family transcriptional regulator
VPTTPRWLSAEERRTWIAFLYAQSLLLEQIERDLQRDSELPLAYYQILVVLSEHPGRTMRMNELADALLWSRSRLSHAIARLEAHGWVRRATCQEDRRGQLAELTDEGFAVLAAAAPQHVESVRAHLIDRLSPEQATALREACEAIIPDLVRSLDIAAPSVLPEPGYWESRVG